MQLKFYRMRELASVPARKDKPARQGRYPVSEATIWRWTAAGKFPAPIKINGTTAWPAEVIEQWEREQAQQTAKPVDAESQRRLAWMASVAARRAKREAEAA